MAQARIPVVTTYDGGGFQKAKKDADDLTKTQEEANRKLVASQKRAAAVAAGLETAALTFIASQARESIELYKVQAAAEAQLAAAIKSTGGAAGYSASELKKMASGLQGVTNYGDEATIQAEALLLTFTNIRGEIYSRALPAILDMSTAMGQDLKASTVQLGKALNDPIKGVSALSEVGVSFTEQQKEQIKTLVESGKTAEAQAMILAELEKEFGGSAKAAREADQGAQALANSYGDLKEALGALITPSGAFNEALIKQLDATTGAIKNLSALAKVYNKLNETGDPATDTMLNMDTAARALQNPAGVLIQLFGQLAGNTEAWAAAADELNQEAAKTTGVLNQNTAAVNDNAAANEEAAKTLEEHAKIRRDAARELVSIDEKARDDSSQAWQDYYDDYDKAQADNAKRATELKKDLAKDLAKIDSDLAKDLAKLNKDSAKSLAKINTDENKQITDLKERAAKDQTNERRRAQVDALADERLFNFELQNLAAEGEGNRIREAIARREIEQQIAKEKAAVEGQIEQDKLADDIARTRAAAEEKRAELRADSEERRQLLEEEATAAAEARKQEFSETVQAEQESFAQRLADLAQYRDDKLAEIEQGRQDSIEATARELAETGDLTKEELAALVPVAGALGEEAGKAFAEGLSRGYETNQQVDQMLSQQDKTSGGGYKSPRRRKSFDVGGIIPGPIGAPVDITAHGGELLTPASIVQGGAQAAQRPSISIVVSNPIVQDVITIDRLTTALQSYTDNYLVPALQ